MGVAGDPDAGEQGLLDEVDAALDNVNVAKLAKLPKSVLARAAAKSHEFELKLKASKEDHDDAHAP